GGLALDTYAATMEGGASGEVVYAADLESSRLWHLVNHEDEPTMPPNQDKMAQPKLDLIAKWINEGAAEQAGAAVKKSKKPTLQFQPADIDDGSPGAMPGKICKQPVEVTSRASAVSALAASPRAPLIAVAGQRQVVLYHSETSELLGVIPYPEGTPHVIRFSRDGGMLLIAGGRGAKIGNVALHDVVTGKRLTTIGDELDVVLAADIDKTLSYVVLGGPQKLVRIFSAGTGEMLYEMDKHTDWVTAAEFSPDGKFLATGDRAGGLVVWEAETGREYQVHDGHKQQVTAISWRGDSKVFATSSEEGNIRIWNPESRKQIKNWGHGGGAIQVTYARDGNLFSVGRDRRVKRWDGNGKNTNNYDPFADIAMCVCASHDSQRVFAGDWTGTIRGFQIATPKPVTTLAANPKRIQDRLAVAKTKLQEDFAATGRQRQVVEAARKKYFEVRPAYLEVIYKLTSSEKQTREARAKVAELQRQLQQDPPDEQALRNQLKAHTSRLANLTQQVTNHARQFTGPIKNLNVAKMEVHDQRRAVRLAQQTHATQQKTCQTIANELAEFTRTPGSLQQALTTTEAEIAATQKQLEQTRMALAALQKSKPATPAETAESPSDGSESTENTEEKIETESPPAEPDNTEELTRLSDLLVKLESDLANMEAKAAGQSAALEFWNASYSK
ncbi:MAG: c-type cytochrome domain-containing protein, partial [Planctomycetota bacterium]